MKVRLNEDKEIVARIKEGLKRTGGYCRAGLPTQRKTSACARSSATRSRILTLKATAIVCSTIRKNKRRPGVRTYGRRAEFIELNYAFIMALSAIPHCRKQFRR